jgi:hypothetical protein
MLGCDWMVPSRVRMSSPPKMFGCEVDRARCTIGGSGPRAAHAHRQRRGSAPILGCSQASGVQRSDNGCRARMRINEGEGQINNAEKEPSREGCNR